MTLLTVEEAADLARCDHRIIRRAIRAGDLEARYSSKYLVEDQAVLDWMREQARLRIKRPSVTRRVRRPSKPRDDRTGSVTQLRAMQGGETG